MSIDAKVIKLGKLFVPKTTPFSKFDKRKSDACCGRYVSTGYFNYISIYNLASEINSPLYKIHQASEKIVNVPEDDECSYQYVKVFTNIDSKDNSFSDYYNKEKVNDFWSDQSSVLFVSMIHIGNSDLKNTISEINSKLNQHLNTIQIQFLLYYTFDYSDIIIFAKSNSITNYMNCIEELNFGLKEKLIEDSYTIYGYNADYYEQLYLENCDKKFSQVEWKHCDDDEEAYYASINIGLQSKDKLKELVCDAKRGHRSVKVYRMYGRHDVSIINYKATSKWLLYVLMKIDKLSSSSNKQELGGMILYETFIKSNLTDEDLKVSTVSNNNDDKETFYYELKSKLDTEFNKLLSVLSSNEKFERYKYPVQEIKNSTLSIIKNNFAEEFVLSMFESFIVLMRHMKDIIQSNNSEQSKKEQIFNKYVNDYFTTLNNLVSTIMHSDRQFIQATSFNAIFFDVPPKLVAYYSSLMYQLKSLMKEPREKDYAFIFAPNLEQGITLKSLSNEAPPVDRIVSISITEDSMYNLNSVFRRLAHETAHYAGDSFRCRDIRKERLIATFLYLVFYHHEDIIIDEKIYEIIPEIVTEIKNEDLIDFSNNYSVSFEDMEVILKSSLVYAKTNDKSEQIHRIIEQRLIEYYKNSLSDNTIYAYTYGDFYRQYQEYMDQKGIIGKAYRDNSNILIEQIAHYNVGKFFETYDEMILINEGEEFNSIHDVFKTFIDIYIEAFADLQSVIILDLSFEAYISCFINEEELNYANIANNLFDLGRIVIVSKLFLDIGKWDYDSFKDKSTKVNQLRDIVLTNIDVINSISDNQTISNKIRNIKNLIKNNDLVSKANGDASYTYNSTEPGEVDLLELFYPFALLYDYLLNCLEKCINEYTNSSQKKKIINSIREQFEALTEFEDIIKILTLINKSNQDYKNHLKNI